MKLVWQPWGMCGDQTTLPNGETLVMSGWQSGSGDVGGFELTHRFQRHRYADRAEAMTAAQWLADEIERAHQAIERAVQQF